MNHAAQIWIDRFVAHLKQRNLSTHTSAAYAQDLSELASWCEQQSLQDWTQLDHHQVRRFAASEHRRGIGARSIQRRLSSVRNFFNYLIGEGELKINPALDIRAPKAAKHLPMTLDTDQMARLLAFRADNELDKRDKAIMELFYSSGLRLAELAGLNMLDINLADRTVLVMHAKGKKQRIVPIGRFAISALQAWFEVRSQHMPNTQAVFISHGDKRMSMRAIQLRVARWAKQQGLSQHVYPHLFRHSFASHLLESSQDLRGVQELLGHTNISTTQVYTHLDFQHLAKIYDATHPRAGHKTKDTSAPLSDRNSDSDH